MRLSEKIASEFVYELFLLTAALFVANHLNKYGLYLVGNWINSVIIIFICLEVALIFKYLPEKL